MRDILAKAATASMIAGAALLVAACGGTKATNTTNTATLPVDSYNSMSNVMLDSANMMSSSMNTLSNTAAESANTMNAAASNMSNAAHSTNAAH